MPTFIDVTPTWEMVAIVWIEVLKSGSPTAQEAAKHEILRMARLADLYVARMHHDNP